MGYIVNSSAFVGYGICGLLVMPVEDYQTRELGIFRPVSWGFFNQGEA